MQKLMKNKKLKTYYSYVQYFLFLKNTIFLSYNHVYYNLEIYIYCVHTTNNTYNVYI